MPILSSLFRRRCRVVFACLLLPSWLLGLAGCAVLDGRLPATMPVISVPAAKTANAQAPLVVFLPGRGDDVEDLRRRGIAQIIQQAVPGASVLLVGATLDFYRQGDIVDRLQREIIGPARRRGVKQIWLAGISLGGLGAMLYESRHPGAVDRLILLSPYMGDSNLIDEISAAGGPPHWVPGNGIRESDGNRAGREAWRVVKTWNSQPALSARVWLACGSKDYILPAAKLIASQIPSGHFVEVVGTHDWAQWTPAARLLFKRVELDRQSSASAQR